MLLGRAWEGSVGPPGPPFLSLSVEARGREGRSLGWEQGPGFRFSLAPLPRSPLPQGSRQACQFMSGLAGLLKNGGGGWGSEARLISETYWF